MKKKARPRLKSTLILSFTLFGILPILVLGGITFLSVHNFLDEEVKSKNFLLAKSLAGEVEEFMAEALVVINHTGDILDSGEILHAESVDRFLEIILFNAPFFEMIQVLDRDGILLRLAPYQPDYLGIDMSHQPYFKQQPELWGRFWSDSFISPQTENATITISLPLREQTLVGFLNLSRLNDITDRIRIGETGYVVMTDRQGTVIAHRDRSLVMERSNLKSLEPIRKALSGKEGTYFFSQGGKKKIGSVALVSPTGWTVVVIQACEEAFGVILRIRKIMAVLVLVTLILAWLLAFTSIRKIVRPLSLLVDSTYDIAGGDYRFTPPPGSYREVETLSEAVRSMSQAIASREEALRESEEKYRELVQRSGSIIIRWDTEGRLTFINEFAQSFLGYSEEELLGKPVIGTIVPWQESSGRDLERMIREIARRPEGYHSNENENIRKDGSRVWIQWSNKPVYDERGSLVEILSIGNDATERKKLEEELRQSQKMQAVGRLAGGIAHDFNNLITAINGYCELILGELEEGHPLREDIEEIRKVGQQAASLTERLLAFSRRRLLSPRVLDLNKLVRDMERILHRLIGEDIRLVTILAEDLNPIKADPVGVEQIVMNLCLNARDAMPKGGTLTIETANTLLSGDAAGGYTDDLQPGPYVRLSVSDTGIGIDPEAVTSIFEPFFTTKEMGNGVGLGLSLVYGIVKQSGGSVRVESKPEMGTRFEVLFPPSSEPG